MRKSYTVRPLSSPNPVTGKSSTSTPCVRVRLGKKGITTPRFDAVVDSGCPYCLFHADFAKVLKIDLESGVSAPIRGVHGGGTDTYFHKVKIYVESDWVIDVFAGFVKKFNFAGLLGRNGFFDNFQVRFDHSGKEPEFEITRIQRQN